MPSATHPAVRIASAMCLAVSLLVFVLRLDSVREAMRTAPGVAVTSGYEEESWFALWRFVHDQPVYADPTRVPFEGTYFNWLFYAAYGVVADVAVQPLGDAAIPLVGRTLTAFFALGGVIVLWKSFCPGRDRVTGLALALFAFTGPLIGWWALTVRPDMAALFCEALGLAFILRTDREARTRNIVAAAAAFFAAWSFKQVYIAGLAAALVCLVWHKDWKHAAGLAGAFLVLVGAASLLGGPSYRAALLHTAAVNDYYGLHGLRNLGAAVAKAAPLWVLPGLMLMRWRTLGRAAWTTDPRGAQLAWTGLGLATATGLTLSSKLGASTNYFFSTLPFLVGLNALALRAAAPARFAAAPFLLALALHVATCAGAAGSPSLAAGTRKLSELWTEWQHYPEPRFSSLTVLNLPWISPGSPPLVLGFNYRQQRRDGTEFERGGVGGMIERGEFEALLLPAHQASKFDGTAPDRYVAEKQISGFVFLRKQPAK